METVAFKGNKDGISMMLDCSVDFEQLCQMIVQKLWQSRDFLGEHMSLIVHSGNTPLNEGQKLALKVLLQSLGHTVKDFVCFEEPLQEKIIHNEVAEQVVEQSTVCDKIEQKSSQSDLSGLETYLAQGDTLIIRKNIRSGQRVEFGGTLVIFGDVNAGAEIIAGGHILIIGTMRGMAHAGSNNNQDSVVYASKLLPLQLRIADLIARAPDGEILHSSEPEIARIIDNQLVIETCLNN